MSGLLVTPHGAVVLEHSNSLFVTWLGREYPAWATFDTTFPLMQSRFPIIGCVLYLISLLLAPKADRRRPKTRPKSKTMIGFCAVHNCALMVFSAMCFYFTVPVTYSILSRGLHYTACVSGFKEAEHWDFAVKSSFGYWVWLFYLSKYYEFIDTWIVIAKGRRPIFLQVFHHIGAVFCLWMAVGTRSVQSWIFVCFNSFVHTWMYAYYLYSSLGFRFKYKRLITTLQMTQFIGGMLIASYLVGRYYFYEGCAIYTNWDAFACIVVMVYTMILFGLFYGFYQAAYKAKKIRQCEAAKLKKSR